MTTPTPRLLDRSRRVLRVVLLTLLAAQAGAFQYSRAPVVNDPTGAAPGTAKLWPHISLREARFLFGRPGVVFVDGRDLIQWTRSHIPGALLLPSYEFRERYPKLKARLASANVVVCYCHGFNCGAADRIAGLLADQGLRNMAVFLGGFPAWQKALYPLEGHDFPKHASPASGLTHP